MTRLHNLVSLEAMAEAAECLKTIAHPCRLRMLQMLHAGEFSVGELAEACEIPSHMASEHLGLMKDRGLLLAEKRGRSTYYKVAEKGLESILNCVIKRFG